MMQRFGNTAQAAMKPLFMAMLTAGMALMIETAAMAVPIPDHVAAMIEAAASDAAQLKTVVDIAKKTNPDSTDEIDARVKAIGIAKTQAKQEKLAAQNVLDGWSGSGEVGAFASTGNTSNVGAVIGLKAAKETRRWKHSFNGIIDYQRQSGLVSKQRYLAGYEGHYNISPALYSLLTLSYESDRFSGFNRRFAESVGLGYNIFDTPTFRLSAEAGPGIRQTRFTDGIQDDGISARGAGNLWWKIAPDIVFTQDGSAFYSSFNTSFQARTALTTKLNGSLSARASFQMNTESNPPIGRRTSDTTSRVSLVYGF
jgi:putative salt-induced outer membrane protein